MINLEQIAYDIGVGKSNDLKRWMLPIATLEEMIALIRKQEVALNESQALVAAQVRTVTELTETNERLRNTIAGMQARTGGLLVEKAEAAAPAAAVVTVDTMEFLQLRQDFQVACFEASDRDIDTPEMTAARAAMIAPSPAQPAPGADAAQGNKQVEIKKLTGGQTAQGGIIATTATTDGSPAINIASSWTEGYQQGRVSGIEEAAKVADFLGVVQLDGFAQRAANNHDIARAIRALNK